MQPPLYNILYEERNLLLLRVFSGSSISEGRAFIQDALDQFHNPTFTTSRCTAGRLTLFNIQNAISQQNRVILNSFLLFAH